MNDSAPSIPAKTPTRSPLRSTTFRIMLTAMLVGAVMWIYAAATSPGSESPATTSVNPQSLKVVPQGLAPITHAADSEPEESPADRARRLIDDSAPALFRFGLSFVAAFFLGWMLKKFIKLTILVAGALAVGVIALQRAGVIGIEGDQIREEAERSFTWMRGQAGALRDLATGYLPTGFAAAFGGYKGFRS